MLMVCASAWGGASRRVRAGASTMKSPPRPCRLRKEVGKCQGATFAHVSDWPLELGRNTVDRLQGMQASVVVLVLGCAVAAWATSGVDVSTNYGAVFSCLVSNGYDFAIIRGYEQIGQPDPVSPGAT